MISFIILHYKNIDDTIECVQSVSNLRGNKNIIIVDNNTMSESEVELIRKYTDDIIINNKNIGFAKANNIGCNYAIKKYNPDFLCVINNDILIKQLNFVELIEKIYVQTNFDILGPRIETNDGDSVNPFPAYSDLNQIKKQINKTKRLIKIYENRLLRILLKLYINCKKKLIEQSHLKNGYISQYNVALHGCALIFSKKYYKKYNDIFYNQTFLYHEEEFLEYRRKKDNLITYYDPNLKIFHKEGSSLNYNFNSDEYKKLIFKNKEILKSLTLLKSVIEKGENI